MLPPAAPADPYDIPDSPVRTKKTASIADILDNKDPVQDAIAVNQEAGRNGDINGARDSEPVPPVQISNEPPKEDKPVEKRHIDPVEEAIEASKNEEPKEAESKPQPRSESKPEPEPETETISKPEPPAVEPKKVPAETAETLELEINDFVNHRVDESNATVEIQVEWAIGETTWETEWSLQTQTPGLVYKYWDERGGRDEATGLDIYHVFRILKREVQSRSARSPKYLYEVQWVGYRRSESSWESEDKVREIAPGELSRFEAKYGTAPQEVAQKRGVARKPGRPRKKAKLDD